MMLVYSYDVSIEQSGIIKTFFFLLSLYWIAAMNIYLCFILIHFLHLTRQAMINNCLKTVQENQYGKVYTRCQECRDGYYLKAGLCNECKNIPGIRNVQCIMKKTYTQGSNIPIPQLDPKNGTNKNTTIKTQITQNPTKNSTPPPQPNQQTENKAVTDNKTQQKIGLIPQIANPVSPSTSANETVLTPANAAVTNSSTSSGSSIKANQSTNASASVPVTSSSLASVSVSSGNGTANSGGAGSSLLKKNLSSPVFSLASENQTFQTGSKLSSLSLQLENCKQVDFENKCTKCFIGYALANGICAKNQKSLEKQIQSKCLIIDEVKNQCYMCQEGYELNQHGICVKTVKNQSKTQNANTKKEIDTPQNKVENKKKPLLPITLSRKETDQLSESKQQKANPSLPSPNTTTSNPTVSNTTVNSNPTNQPHLSNISSPLINVSIDESQNSQQQKPTISKGQISIHSSKKSIQAPQQTPSSSPSSSPSGSAELKFKIETKHKSQEYPFLQAQSLWNQNSKAVPTVKVVLNVHDKNTQNQSYVIQANTDNCAEYVVAPGNNATGQVCASCMKDFIWNDITKKCIQVSRPLELFKTVENKTQLKNLIKEDKSDKASNVSVNINSGGNSSENVSSTTIIITVNSSTPNNTIISITNKQNEKSEASNNTNTNISNSSSSSSSGNVSIVNKNEDVNKIKIETGGGAIILSKSQTNILTIPKPSIQLPTAPKQPTNQLSLPPPIKFGTNFPNLPVLTPLPEVKKALPLEQNQTIPVDTAERCLEFKSATNATNTSTSTNETLGCLKCQKQFQVFLGKCYLPLELAAVLKQSLAQKALERNKLKPQP